ncbi:MAG: glycosyl-4,4'-diaponeurosporenoate acyltransferase [Clostridiaceae bacterium]|nr:glycosyl-4,4'-diaponeurosporenoate acyltransferase [Clostridiaceae bacterium]
MRIIELPMLWTVIIDFVAWFIFHMAAAIFTLKLPDRFFAKDNWIYRTRKWEKSGKIWDDLFRVKKWKDRLPDGAAILKQGFAKNQLKETDAKYFEKFVLESRRAECTHYLAMMPAVLFFLWNPVWVGIVMIFYALIANAPCILAQRYNRPRFAKAARMKASLSQKNIHQRADAR